MTPVAVAIAASAAVWLLWTSGYRTGWKRSGAHIQKQLDQQHAARVARWQADTPPIPAVDPRDPATLVDAYGQTAYNAARLSYDALTAPDQIQADAELTRLMSEARRLEADLKSRLTPVQLGTDQPAN